MENLIIEINIVEIFFKTFNMKVLKGLSNNRWFNVRKFFPKFLKQIDVAEFVKEKKKKKT